MISANSKKTRRILVLGGTLVMLVTMACLCTSALPDLLNGGESAPPPASGGGTDGDVAPPPSGGGGPSVTVVNATEGDVCDVFISPVTESTWGDSVNSGRIGPGESQTFDVDAGDYDLRADDCNGDTLVEQYAAKITTAGLTWTLSDTEGVTLTLVNNSSQTICYVYFSPTDAEDWGPDQLDSDQVLPAGQSVDFQGITPGMYDLRVEACDTEDAVEDYGLDLSGDFEYTITD